MTGSDTPRYTRREAAKAALGTALLASGGSLLAGRGVALADNVSRSIIAGPRRGGTLHAGVTGGGASDTLDPHNLITNPDLLRTRQLFDSLVAFDEHAQPQLALAQEFIPNSTATEWTVRVRPDVTFHNGAPLTADDVIYTFQRIANPKAPLLGAASLQTVDVANIKKLDKYTVRIPCHSPFVALYEVQACYYYSIVPVGFDPKHPVGTGPYVYKSFTPGVASTFTRNAHYWQSGLPYTDAVVISNFTDETSQVNALTSGAVNLVDSLSGASIAPVKAGGARILASNGGQWTPFTMRMDQPPFSDVRVRQAFRLIANREQMRELVFDGRGALGNDLFGIWDPMYNHSLPQRVQDTEQARHLLKQAGHEKLTVTLVTADVGAGTTQVAQVFAQQAAASGVTVKLQQIPVSTLFGPNYLKWTFAQDSWTYAPYTSTALENSIPGSVFNECHVNDPTYTALFHDLLATTDVTRRTTIAHEMQARQYEADASGYLVPYFLPEINGYASNVNGLAASATGNSFGDGDLKVVWLS